MTDKPIIFSAPMIRALLDGRKTQTRRVLKPQPPEWCYDDQKPGYSMFTPLGHIEFRGHYVDVDGRDHGPGAKFIKLPCTPGDRLYVRETVTRQETDQGVGYQTYAACGTEVYPLTRWYHDRKSIPSIHMPRWASRLTLTVTDVRVQRLQETDATDARAEGMTREYGRAYPTGPQMQTNNEVQNFAVLWNSIHGPDAWNVNPWVVALTFDVHRCNIDQMGQV